MIAKDLRAKTVEELMTALKDCKETLFNKRFQTEIEQSGGAADIRKVRRDIARIKTVLREKGHRV